ncbi:MAG: hypothetical protein JSW34_03215 [Candidatus Zixiibacteriota bacterium]|nr:MAG: hypothetical protein JSW34_03215 [candidate division Zixibacteria bacterium]
MNRLSDLQTIILVVDFAFMAVLIIAGNLVYFLKVLPTLDKFGSRGVPRFMPSGQRRQCKEYRRLCVENGVEPRYWWFVSAFPYLIGAGLAIWIGLFLADVFMT